MLMDCRTPRLSVGHNNGVVGHHDDVVEHNNDVEALTVGTAPEDPSLEVTPVINVPALSTLHRVDICHCDPSATFSCPSYIPSSCSTCQGCEDKRHRLSG